MHTSTAPVRAFLGAGLAGVLALTGAATTTSPAAADTSTTARATSATEDPGKLLLMLDASGSMKEPDPAGGTKMDAAKKALTGVVNDLPSDTNVGLRVYGATEPGGKPTKAACADTQLAVPIGPLDKDALTDAIKGFEAKGETPIAHSLTKAMDDLGTEGKRNIILVSDGEESCVPDPCPVVKDLVQDGVDLRIDTVGFGVKDTAREQLQCIADAGNGTYYDAADADELATSLDKISTRAVREFTVAGTPITMTEDETEAPTITPGRYTDAFTVSDKPRYARITRTANSTVHTAIVARPPSQGDNTDWEKWEITLTTPDGTECGENRASRMEFFRSGSSLSVGTTANFGVTEPAEDDVCATSAELLLTVQRTEGAKGEAPIQLLYIEEPAVTDVASLPGPVDGEKITGWTAKGDDSPEPTIGGGGFGDAATLAPGTYTDTVLPGEQLYYRVRVDYGQRAAFTATIDGVPLATAMTGSDHQLFTVESWNPALRSLTRLGGTPENRTHISDDTKSLVLGEYIPEVRYRNKEISRYETDYTGLWHVSMGGYYYFALSRDADRDELSMPLDVRIDVDVTGQPTGKPTFADAAATDDTPTSDSSPDASDDRADETTATASASEDEGGSPLPWLGGGLLATLVLGAGAWFGIRRRGTSTEEN